MYVFLVAVMAISKSTGPLPTYGELIDLFNKTQRENPNNEVFLSSEFKKMFPRIQIGRPRRVHGRGR